MQQELGSPDTEEDEMNGDSENLQGALPQAADAVDAAGALSVYKDPNVLKAQTEYDTLAKKQTDRYDALERAIAEKRYAPSFSERMFQLSAALAAPTSRRGFGGILDNITPVLAAQEKAKREGEISRREALEKLDADRLAQQVGLAKQGLATSLSIAKLDAMARKGLQPKYVLGPDGKWRIQPGTGNSPPMNAKGQYIVSTPEEANMVPTGAEFVYATDKSNKVYWGK
jgi:hypothetical protein